MKNFFDYATKETSQDSVLCWIFENWKEPDFKDLVCNLLNNFNINISYNDITNIKAYRQICKVDVTVVIETADKYYILFIEDKTESDAHTNQLLKYDSMIFGGPLKNDKHDFRVLEEINNRYGKVLLIPDNSSFNVKFYNYEVHRVFYKTAPITNIDTEFLNECKELPFNFSARKEALSDGWKVFGLDDICKVFTTYKASDNIVLSMYANHILNTSNNFVKTDRPLTEGQADWFIYFSNVIKPYFEEKQYVVDVYKYQGRESGIKIKCNIDENVVIHVSNKDVNKDLIKLSLDSDTYDKNKVNELKSEIKRMNDAFGCEVYPFKISDKYINGEYKIIATAKLSLKTTDEIIASFEKALAQLNYIEHELKIL